jgi:hypothetical protein
MKPQHVGIFFQIFAIVVGALALWAGPFSMLLALVDSAPRNWNLNIDVGDCLLPFTLWFMGAELRRNSELARRVSLLAMGYLAFMAALALLFTWVSGWTALLSPHWVALLYGALIAALILPSYFLFVLRRRAQS